MNARCAIFMAFLAGGTVTAGAAQDVWESSFPIAVVAERNVYFAARYFDVVGYGASTRGLARRIAAPASSNRRQARPPDRKGQRTNINTGSQIARRAY